MIRYLRSFSTRLGYCIGALMYASYAFAGGTWSNGGLVFISAFVGVFLPFYSRISNKAEEIACLKTALVTAGRLARFAFQFAFNLFIFRVLIVSGVVSHENISRVGGFAGVAAVTTVASQGIQYLCIIFANREIGNKNANVMLGLSANIVVTALSASGVSWVRPVFLANGIVFGLLVFGVGIASDIRARFAPKGGVGVFLGTFNPFHKTHLSMLRAFIEERGLELVYLHSTVVPRLHQEALRKGEIRVAKRERGMRVYERTDRADVHAQYFPTGNRFYEFETRKKIMELALADAGLTGKTRVLDMRETYEKTGFYGILSAIKRENRGKRIHVLHGSDLGGMWIRSIYDESGWFYPYPVVRKDDVSATAIRDGARGMAAGITEDIIENINRDAGEFLVRSMRFVFRDGILAVAADAGA